MEVSLKKEIEGGDEGWTEGKYAGAFEFTPDEGKGYTEDAGEEIKGWESPYSEP